MAYAGKEIPFNDFSGGQASNVAITQLAMNQALEVDNIITFPKGKGFRSRLGDTAFNSTAMNSGANVQGLHYYKQIDLDEYLVAVAGNKIYKSEMDGTMDEITNSLTVTAGQNNIWTFITFNNTAIAFGGPQSAPDAPFVTSGGNATALGGTPPSAYGCFQANNRVFAFHTAASPSIVQWSIVGNGADWTGTGSGSQTISTSDNDTVTAAAVMNTNTVLIFKENSIHQMQIGALVSSAFPVFPLFRGVGCAGKHAVVVADGLAYFITPQGKMKITDGTKIYDEKDIPNLANIDDEWALVPTTRLPYVQGIRHTGADFDHIKWHVSSGSSATANNRCLIWDLTNQCWLRNTTGYDCNVAAITQAGVMYGGHTDGKIYKKEVASTVTDVSEGSLLIDGYWASDWIANSKFESIKQPRKMNVSFDTQTSGNIRISYGFDFSGLSSSVLIDQTAPGGVFDVSLFDVALFAQDAYNIKPARIVGRGNVFRYKIRTPTESYPMSINGFTLSGKESGQKEILAR